MSLIERARRAMTLPLPGFSAQAKMMPPGRIMPADTSDAHIGGVLLLAYPFNGQDHIVLTRRVETLGKHGGQISFPGGRRDTSDADLAATALREAREELGITLEDVEVLGALTPLYIPPSHYLIHPTVAILSRRPVFAPSAAEVAEVIEAPLVGLALPASRSVTPMPVSRNGTTFVVDMPHFVVGPYRVWGATAMVLSEFLELLAI